MIYEIEITLKYSDIWRKVKINPNISLHDFHKIIQTAMGWENSHLYQFISAKTYFGISNFDDFEEMDTKDSKNYKVKEILNSKKRTIIYEYDFGDGWNHKIKLIKTYKNEDILHPICVNGEKCCPPEDCGGVWGYENKLDITKDKNHEEYEEMIEWIGEDFDPEYFDIKSINKTLALKNFGCFEISY